MTVYLFIYAVMAGSLTGPQHPANNHQPVWKAEWQNAGKFDRPEHCHKAAANLGLKREEYRCIDLTGGVQ